MNAAEAIERLRRLGVPLIETSEAAAAFRESVGAANKTLGRLAAAGLIRRIHRGLWLLEPELDPLRAPEYLTSPYPAYVSLFTALHRYGMVEQIPSVIYAVTLDRTRRVHTAIGDFSFHHVTPGFFAGFIRTPSGAPIATPEKALADVCYLSAGRSRLFRKLPELSLPPGFRIATARRWIGRIGNARLRTHARDRLEAFLASAETAPRSPRR